MTLAVSGAASALFYLCLVMMFSHSVAAGMVSGFMEMGKSIYYNRFFYRFESLLLFFLIFSSVMSACLGLFAARKSFGFAFGGKPRTLTVVCAGLALAVALIPANLSDLVGRYFAIARNCSVYFAAGVPLLLFVISSLRRALKREK
jgi:hypothetical protein